MYLLLAAEEAVNSETQAVIMFWLPWVLLVSGAIAWALSRTDAFQARVQALTRGFTKMGSVKITEIGEAIARNDKPAMFRWYEKIAEEYKGEEGAKKFVWDVIQMGGDDLLKDPKYSELFGKWIEEQVLGFLIDDDVQADLMPTAVAMEKLNMKDSAAIVSALSRGKAQPVRDAIRRLVERFRHAEKVDDEIVSWLVGGTLQTLVKQPEHTDAILKACGADDDLLGFVLTDEVQADLVPVAMRMSEYGMKGSAEFIGSLGRNNKKNAMIAFHALIKRFLDPEKIDEEIMSVAQKGIPKLMQDPIHAATLRALVNGPPSLEEQRAALDKQIAAKGGSPLATIDTDALARAINQLAAQPPAPAAVGPATTPTSAEAIVLRNAEAANQAASLAAKVQAVRDAAATAAAT